MGTLNSDIDANKTSSKMAAYIGKYDRTSAENYDEFLKELDVNFMLRKAATASSPVFEVSVDGEEICFKTSTMLKTMELKFKLGVEFDEKSPDGRDVKAIVTQEGDKFISVQTAKKEGEKSTEIIREFKGDEMIATSKCIVVILFVHKFSRNKPN